MTTKPQTTTVATEASKLLKKYFGYDSFRPHQEEIIERVCDGGDTIVLMPTGGGKSICFQIPALLMSGTCVVVSPLIALMKDQVEGLKVNGIAAAYLNSSLTMRQEFEIIEAVKRAEIKLLYVSPEKLLTRDFYNLIKSIKVNLFAIDEAHCISSWGHDFRPEYTKMKFLKTHFKDVPVIALTATADKVTRSDIATQLGLNDSKIFISSFDRPNLSLNVLPGRDRIKQILHFLTGRKNQPGIIYCLSRRSTEDVAAKLQNAGFDANYYHAGMPSDMRSKVQEDFLNDNLTIICATIAFGMGIDKSNIRWIMHYNMPKNIEGYYQEIGRSGRDGLKSDTVLFYSFADVINLRKFVEESGQRDVQTNKLERMQEYAESFICRRKILLSYFGETLSENCNNCDVCNNPPEMFDGTLIVQKALSAVYRCKEKIATGILIDILRGAMTMRIQENNYHKIKTYAAGKDIKHAEWQQYIQQMVHQGVLEIAYIEGNALKLTDISHDVLFNNKKVELVKPSVIEKEKAKRKEKSAKKAKTPFVADLFETLRKLRKDIATELGVPPYVVFSDASLKDMVETKPMTEDDFIEVSGVGQKKLERFGEQFMQKIKEYTQQENRKLSKEQGSTQNVTLNYLTEGLSIPEIAKKRSLKDNTIYGHLIKLYEEGHEIDLHEYITEEEINHIKKGIRDLGDEFETVKDLFIHLNEEIPYYKINIVFALETLEK